MSFTTILDAAARVANAPEGVGSRVALPDRAAQIAVLLQSMTETRLTPPFIADSRGLDFLNTLWKPGDVEVEGLSKGEALLAWLLEAELVTQANVDEVHANANPGELDAVAAQARGLREWFRGFVLSHRGKALTGTAVAQLEPLNKLLARDAEFSQLVLRPRSSAEDGPPLEFVAQRRWKSPESLLFPLANALAVLVSESDFADVKGCEGPGCVLQFLDTTRDRRRRWCSMATCGNRAKQLALRLRRAGA
jgi:predicted RNA-binding Zn ribbon-like protein